MLKVLQFILDPKPELMQTPDKLLASRPLLNTLGNKEFPYSTLAVKTREGQILAPQSSNDSVTLK